MKIISLVFVAIVLMIIKVLHVLAPVAPFLKGWHHLEVAQARKLGIIHTTKIQQQRKRHVYSVPGTTLITISSSEWDKPCPCHRGVQILKKRQILNKELMLVFCCLFLRFYLFIQERQRERQRHRQREKQASRREPNAGPDPGFWDHDPSWRQALNCWATQMSLTHGLYTFLSYSRNKIELGVMSLSG